MPETWQLFILVFKELYPKPTSQFKNETDADRE
jgi:hypothetical protein